MRRDADDESEKSGSSCTDGTIGSASTAASSSRHIHQVGDAAGELQPSVGWSTDWSEVTDHVGGQYAWMVCHVQLATVEDGAFVTSVVPCTTQEAVAFAQAAGGVMEMWCWLQPDGHGSMMAIPCNDRPLHMVEKAPTAAELACAPAPPATGSYRPAWVVAPRGHVTSPPTTLVFSNLPSGLAQEALLEVLDRADFNGFYDFVFLEADPDTGLTCGTAVVNCTRHTYALSMAAQFHGRMSWPTRGEDTETNPCKVLWSSSLQGLESLISSFRDHPLNQAASLEELRPQLFKEGWPLPFPAQQA